MASVVGVPLISYDCGVSALPEPAWPLSDGVVALRRFRLDDVGEVTRACQDTEIPRWTASIPQPYEDHHAWEWIAKHDSFWAEETQAPFAFCWASTGDLLGSMTLDGIDMDRRTAGAGYWAAPWARNRGTTTRALEVVCRWGFDVLGLRVIHLMTLLGTGRRNEWPKRPGSNWPDRSMTSSHREHSTEMPCIK